MRISDLTNKEIESYKKKIETSDGISFDHYEILKRINKYSNDEFYECEETDAIFWNLGRGRVPHFAKKIDLDTKNFKLTANGDANAYQAWVINMRFQKWAKDTNFALDLDDLAESLATYGSTVMKLMEKEDGGYDMKECDLTKLYFNTQAETLDNETVIERHELTAYQIRRKEGWDNVDKAIKQAEEVAEDADKEIPRLKIYQRVGPLRVKEDGKESFVICEGEEDNEKIKEKFYNVIFTGEGDEEVILYKEEIKPEDSPYIDFHISKYMGRWLRVGVYERLFVLQEHANKLVNQDDQANQIASLLLLMSNDPLLVGKNVLKEAVSGEIIDGQLQQLAIDNRAFNEFIAKLNLIESKADRVCMTPEVITGDQLPSNATVRGQIMSLNMANSSFKSTRDRLGFKLFKVLIDKILPAEVEKWNDEDVFEIAGSDVEVQLYDQIAIKHKLNKFIAKEWANRRNPSQEEKARFIDTQIKKLEMEGRRLEKMKDFFNFEYGFVMNPTGENVNKEQKNQAYDTAMNWFMSNPQVVNIPLFRQYLEENDIPTFKLGMGEMQQFNQTRGGEKPQMAEKQDQLLGSVNNE